MKRHTAALYFVDLLLATCCVAWALSTAAEDDLLAPEQAFQFSARLIEPGLVEVRYRIAEGYYLYRDKFRFSAIPRSAGLGEARFPRGKIKDDEFFGRVETYRGEMVITLPVKSTRVFTLKSVSQGCADAGVCYVPLTQTARLVPARSSGDAGTSGGEASKLLLRLQDPSVSK